MNSTWGGAEVKAMLVRFNNNLRLQFSSELCCINGPFAVGVSCLQSPLPPGELGQWRLHSYNACWVLQFCSPAEQTGERLAAFYGVLLRFGLFFLRKVRRILIDRRWPWFHDCPPVGGVEGTPRLWSMRSWVLESKACFCGQWFGVLLIQELQQLGRLLCLSFHSYPQSWEAWEEVYVVHEEAECPDIMVHTLVRSQQPLLPWECLGNLSVSSTRSQTVLMSSKIYIH